jgi:ligand-binding SRPBCC domain-containing protein
MFRQLSASRGDFGEANFPDATSRAKLEAVVVEWAHTAETEPERQHVRDQVSYMLGAGAVRGDTVGHLATGCMCRHPVQRSVTPTCRRCDRYIKA